MSGGAYDYIEFVPDKILVNLEKLAVFAQSKTVKSICENDAKAEQKLWALQKAIKEAMQAVEYIDTDFLHRVEWVASGDTSKVYESEDE